MDSKALINMDSKALINMPMEDVNKLLRVSGFFHLRIRKILEIHGIKDKNPTYCLYNIARLEPHETLPVIYVSKRGQCYSDDKLDVFYISSNHILNPDENSVLQEVLENVEAAKLKRQKIKSGTFELIKDKHKNPERASLSEILERVDLRSKRK